MTEQAPTAGPPPGPGVAPPFVAAPVEGRRARTGMLFGIAGAAVLGCCIAGAVVLGGVLVLSQEALNEQARAAVDDYMAAVAEQNWREAYEQRCDAEQESESLEQYTARMADRPAVDAYDVGDLEYPEGNSGPFVVPVDVDYADDTGTVLHVPVEEDAEAGGFEVCGRIAGE